MAASIAGIQVEAAGPSEGKMTFKSNIQGLLQVNKEAVDRINELEGISF
ncbi:MAG: hypothetical protein K0S39_445 [Paenibacillus sp.]|nr:hypothetical protein [Paenibacillus sp.]